MSIFSKIKQWFSGLLPKHETLTDAEITTESIPVVDQKNHKHVHRHVETLLMVKFWWVGLAIVAVAYIIFQSLSALYLILGAYIISVALESVVLFFERRGLSRGFSLTLSYIILVAVFLSWFILIVPFVFSQMSSMLDTLVSSVRAFQFALNTQWLAVIIQDISWLPGYAKEYVLDIVSNPQFSATIQSDLQNNISQIVGLWTSYAQNIGNIAVSLISGFFSVVAQLGVVVTLAVFFSIEKKMVMRFISGLWGKKDYDFVYAKLDRIYARLGLWLRGQTIVCLCVWIAVFIVLQILALFGFALPSIWSLAIIAWVTNFIPYLWPFLWGIPAVLLAFVNFGGWGILFVFFAYGLIQQLESSFLTPYVMNRTVGISPLLILICLIIGGLVMWFVWVVLAVPIAVIISMVYGEDK